VLVDGAQRGAYWWWGLWRGGGQQRSEHPVVDLGVEDREGEAVVGEPVAVAAVDADDQAVAAQAGEARLIG
jgi:hypothetical protein